MDLSPLSEDHRSVTIPEIETPRNGSGLNMFDLVEEVREQVSFQIPYLGGKCINKWKKNDQLFYRVSLLDGKYVLVFSLQIIEKKNLECEFKVMFCCRWK